ncbi:MAG: hypothetical protein P9M06_04550 [Candidatus Saelkia tenebricola]|nr:hypothetical protein [Candidatus Saelkia tenebricola]
MRIRLQQESSRLTDKLKEKNMPTERSENFAIPAAIDAVMEIFSLDEDRLMAFKLVIDLGVRLADNDILPCSTLEYGIPLITKVLQLREDKDTYLNVSDFDNLLNSLEQRVVGLGIRGINPYRTLVAALTIVDSLISPIGSLESIKNTYGVNSFYELLKLAELIPIWVRLPEQFINEEVLNEYFEPTDHTSSENMQEACTLYYAGKYWQMQRAWGGTSTGSSFYSLIPDIRSDISLASTQMSNKILFDNFTYGPWQEKKVRITIHCIDHLDILADFERNIALFGFEEAISIWEAFPPGTEVKILRRTTTGTTNGYSTYELDVSYRSPVKK